MQLMSLIAPDDIEETHKVIKTQEVQELIDILPSMFRDSLSDVVTQDALTDIELDLGRAPSARVAGARTMLSSEKSDHNIVTRENLDEIMVHLGSNKVEAHVLYGPVYINNSNIDNNALYGA